MEIPIEKLSRIEIIGEAGRVGTWWDVTVTPMVQDDGRTLKLFIKDRDTRPPNPDE